MNSKFLFGVLAAVLIMGLAVVLKQNITKTTQSAVNVPAPAPNPAVSDMPPPLPLPAVTAPAPPPITEEEREEAIGKEVDRLSDLQTSRDPQAFSNILVDLYSPEKEIRDAAIDAAEQVHNTNAIPVLKSIAMTNDDTDEQMALLDAANFIATPEGDLAGSTPLTQQQIQAAQQRRAQDLAHQQARMQGQQPNTAPAQSPSQPPGN